MFNGGSFDHFAEDSTHTIWYLLTSLKSHSTRPHLIYLQTTQLEQYGTFLTHQILIPINSFPFNSPPHSNGPNSTHSHLLTLQETQLTQYGASRPRSSRLLDYLYHYHADQLNCLLFFSAFLCHRGFCALRHLYPASPHCCHTLQGFVPFVISILTCIGYSESLLSHCCRE